MKTKITPELLDRAFAQLEAAAVAGKRCPFNDEIDGGATATTKLARDQRIFVEVFPHNWRVVTILTGPNKDKKTAPPLNPRWKPYLTVGTDTLRKTANGSMMPVEASPRIAPPSKGQQPSAPRTLTRDELERT